MVIENQAQQQMFSDRFLAKLLFLIGTTTPVITQAQSEAFKQAKFNMEHCMKIVMQTISANIIKVEHRSEADERVYEFDLRDTDGMDWEIVCSAESGEIVEKEREVHSFLSIEYAELVKVSLANARQIALEAYPGYIREIEYEIEANGQPVYEFDIIRTEGSEIKIEIDATTGEIIESNKEFWQIGYE